MRCQRCSRPLSEQEPTFRVYSDVLDIRVCGVCAQEARRLGIKVEIIGSAKKKLTWKAAS
jgi:hypothetical protein